MLTCFLSVLSWSSFFGHFLTFGDFKSASPNISWSDALAVHSTYFFCHLFVYITFRHHWTWISLKIKHQILFVVKILGFIYFHIKYCLKKWAIQGWPVDKWIGDETSCRGKVFRPLSHILLVTSPRRIWGAESEWLFDSWSFTKILSPRLLSLAPEIWKEAVANRFLFKMMEVSGTSCAAEMLLQPPPDLRLDPTLSLGSGGCTSDLMTWRSLWDADYVADGIKEKGCAPQHSLSLGNQEDWNVFLMNKWHARRTFI